MSDPTLSNERLLVFLNELASTGRKYVHAQRVVASDGKKVYTPVQRFPNTADIERHLNSSRPIGIYLVEGSMTRAAVFDLDDHDGSAGFDLVKEIASKLSDALRLDGFKPVLFRSGGGNGIHIWLIWKEPQPARYVRRVLQGVLTRAGLSIGTTGVAQGTVEIFPKQDDVTEGRYGSLIALPLARESAFLSVNDLEPVSRPEWRAPVVDSIYSPAVPALTEARAAAHHLGSLPGDDAEIVEALKHIPAVDYDTWIRVGLMLKIELGDSGLSIWRIWSKTATQKYPGDSALDKRWTTFPSSGTIGIGSLFFLAKQGGWNGPSDPVIREMNARFGIYTHANKTMIIVKNGERRPDDEFLWLSKDVFLDRIKPEKLPPTFGREPGPPPEKGRYWLQHPLAAHYHRLEFDPEQKPGENGRTWNLWRGFAVEPAPGDWSLLKAHIHDNICQGDTDLNSWLLNWMALGVQQPGLVIGTAPVMKGFPGVGKGILANMYGRLWGSHFITVTSEAHVSGHFNAHLAGKRLVFVDEGTFGGNRRDAGTLKTRVTEDWLTFEAKGVDAIRMRNRMILMIASNEESIVPADRADRRWQLFTVGNARRNDRDYFGEIVKQMDNGGTEAMLFELQSRDLNTGPNPQVTIKTEELFEQILRASTPEVRYLHQILEEGRLPQNEVAGPSSTTIKALFEELQKNYPTARHASPIGLGHFIKDVIPRIKSRQGGKYIAGRTKDGPVYERSTRHDFPPLMQARLSFEKYVGQPVPWSEPNCDWQGDDDTPF